MNEYTEKEIKMVKNFIISVIVIIIGIVILCNSIVFVKTGEIGIVTKFGAVQDRVMTEGINFKVPFMQGVKKINCKTQEISTENNGASKDLQDIFMKVSINYCVNVDKAPELFRTVGNDYANVILTPILTDTIKSATAEYTAEETITKRAELSTKIYEKLNERLNEQGISIVNVNITDLTFSEAFNKAIEDKQVAQQNTLKAQQELETTKVEAEKKVTEATATAEANRILNESLSQENLEKQKLENEQKAIEKWNGVLPSTMTGDTVPFVNLK